jgi:hypothetical protein
MSNHFFFLGSWDKDLLILLIILSNQYTLLNVYPAIDLLLL